MKIYFFDIDLANCSCPLLTVAAYSDFKLALKCVQTTSFTLKDGNAVLQPSGSLDDYTLYTFSNFTTSKTLVFQASGSKVYMPIVAQQCNVCDIDEKSSSSAAADLAEYPDYDDVDEMMHAPRLGYAYFMSMDDSISSMQFDTGDETYFSNFAIVKIPDDADTLTFNSAVDYKWINAYTGEQTGMCETSAIEDLQTYKAEYFLVVTKKQQTSPNLTIIQDYSCDSNSYELEVEYNGQTLQMFTNPGGNTNGTFFFQTQKWDKFVTRNGTFKYSAQIDATNLQINQPVQTNIDYNASDYPYGLQLYVVSY